MADNTEKPADQQQENNGAKPGDKPAETVNDDIFDVKIDLDDLGAGESPGDKPGNFDRSKWKEVDDDLDFTEAFDEQKVFERTKSYKEKAGQATLLLEADKIIQGTPQIKNINTALALGNEDLVLQRELAVLKKRGLNEAQAAAQAADTVKKFKEKDWIDFKAEEIRNELTEARDAITGEIQNQIQNTRKAFTLSENLKPETLNNAVKELDKLDNFLGIPFGSKTADGMKKFKEPIVAKMKNGSILKKIQNDPALYAKVAMLVENEAQFTKAIQNRLKSERTRLNERLANAPYSGGAAGNRKPAEHKAGEGPKLNHDTFR